MRPEYFFIALIVIGLVLLGARSVRHMIEMAKIKAEHEGWKRGYSQGIDDLEAVMNAIGKKEGE